MGGQALGLEQAGFKHIALVEIEPLYCQTLRSNRPQWNVIESDIRDFSGIPYQGQVDLLAGGVPCPPFSIAGKQLGANDERDLFPEALRIAKECQPKAIMIENVKGLLSPKFDLYREALDRQLYSIGYVPFWKLHNASDYGVSQLRPRVTLVALQPQYGQYFYWPTDTKTPKTVGRLLQQAMAADGWEGASQWAAAANTIAPTLVGGSKKHGGPDLGPTRAKAAWEALGVNAHTLAENPPEPGFTGLPRLTVKMAALIQGFPSNWNIVGKKTNAYRQVGNAFPPPVAQAIGESIKAALDRGPQ